MGKITFLLTKFTIIILLLSNIFMVLDNDTTIADSPNISNVYPNNINANYNPRLSVEIQNCDIENNIVIFKTNMSGSWQILGTYYGGNGRYTQNTDNMTIKNRKYYWSVNVFNGLIWINESYAFIAQPFVLKWTYNTGAETSIGPLAVDVNKDGIYEVFATGEDTVTCLNGNTGELIWSYQHSGISTHAPFEIHDLNNDGLEELVVAAYGRTIALHAIDGTLYWYNTNADSMEKHLVIADIEGDGYPYVYICSTDVYHGEDGTGRLRKLRGTDGAILKEVFAWRPCWGGLSIADVNNDGNFELFMSDRGSNYGDYGLGKGMQCYDAATLNLIWKDDEVSCSSHCLAIVDVNLDGILDAVAIQQSPGYEQGTTGQGVYCINGLTGERITGKWANRIGIRGHSQFSIYDIDDDGNLELITCDASPTKIWDIGNWDFDATLDSFAEPPKMANVIGDEKLEIIGARYDVKIYNNQYELIETIPTSSIASTLVQDIDNEGQNELILISNSGIIKVYDTSAYAPTPRVRTNSLYYSERNMGAGVYVPPPGAPQPILKEEYPENGALNVDLNPIISIHAIDFHYDLMDITISTNASGTWQDVAFFNDVGNDVYSYTPTTMNQPNTKYWWRVKARDPDGDDLTTTKTYTFTIQQSPTNNPPSILSPSPSNAVNNIPISVTSLSVIISDPNNDY
ncbi:MAG: hypothetical protein KKC68_02240, partial [Candidatus Thermoplasmatota archaeon]|nr:hypothetical protein [Candidatus Thermoplasmatota archaeon]